MKLSDYVAQFLAQQGIRHAFVVTGGASIHLLHSLAARDDITPICPHHEQAGAFAADAYARVTGNLGCAIATSGPGATNLITGIAGAWFDSVPVLFLTGQVASYRQKGKTGVRQLGFQETDIVAMVGPITKYAVQIKHKDAIRYELEKAVHLAKSGRPGPVLIDIPDDFQRAEIEPEEIARFYHEDAKPVVSNRNVNSVLRMLAGAERPVVVLGWGVQLAGAQELARQVIEKLRIPVLTTWGAKDLVPHDHALMAGTFGTHGTRAGNFAVQNADVILAIGARLSTRETGTPMTDFARGAKLIAVDIDQAELDKFAAFGRPVDLPIRADASRFLAKLAAPLAETPFAANFGWLGCIHDWQRRYTIRDEGTATSVKPYAFMRALSHLLPEDETIFVDTGCAVAWLMQAFEVKRQRIFHDCNNTAMGWALPAAIGGCLALGKKPVTAIVGDGALMMNLQELATIQAHNLPIRIILINNDGYAMVRQTEEQWLGGRNIGTSKASGLAFPNFVELAEAFGISALSIKSADTIKYAGLLAEPDALLIDVHIPGSERVMPQTRFGYPIEDGEPLLPRAEFLANMIVPPHPKSLEAA